MVTSEAGVEVAEVADCDWGIALAAACTVLLLSFTSLTGVADGDSLTAAVLSGSAVSLFFCLRLKISNNPIISSLNRNIFKRY